MSKYRKCKCDLCGRIFKEGERVTTILTTEISKQDCPRGKMRLKLSPSSIATRAHRVYCQKCLDLNKYIKV